MRMALGPRLIRWVVSTCAYVGGCLGRIRKEIWELAEGRLPLGTGFEVSIDL